MATLSKHFSKWPSTLRINYKGKENIDGIVNDKYVTLAMLGFFIGFTPFKTGFQNFYDDNATSIKAEIRENVENGCREEFGIIMNMILEGQEVGSEEVLYYNVKSRFDSGFSSASSILKCSGISNNKELVELRKSARSAFLKNYCI